MNRLQLPLFEAITLGLVVIAFGCAPCAVVTGNGFPGTNGYPEAVHGAPVVTSRPTGAVEPVSASTGATGAAAQSGLANAIVDLAATLAAGVQVRMDVTASDLLDIQAALANIQQRLDANVAIGGGGDTVTSWILAAGAACSWLIYPLVWRPIRQAIERRRNGDETPPGAGAGPRAGRAKSATTQRT